MNRQLTSIEDIDLMAAEEKPFDLKGFLYDYILPYWWVYLLGILLSGSAAFLYLRYAEPVYQVKSTILIKDPSSSGEFASEEVLLEELGLSSARMNILNEIPILKSRTLMQEAVRRLGLDVAVITLGRFRNFINYGEETISLVWMDSLDKDFKIDFMLQPMEAGQFKLSFRDTALISRFGMPVHIGNGGTVLFKAAPGYTLDDPVRVEVKSIPELTRNIIRRLKIEPFDKNSSVLELSLQDKSAERAADILNTIVEIYNEAAVEDKNRIAKKTIEFVTDRLALLTGELEGVEKDVEVYKRQNNITTTTGADVPMLLQEMTEADEELSRLEIQQNVAEYLSSFLRSNRGKFMLIPGNLILEEQNLNEQIMLYNEKVLARERLLRSAGEDNPLLKTLTREVLAMEENLLQSVGQLQVTLKAATKQYSGRLDSFQAQSRTIPRKERELLEIVRQQRIKENLYLYLLEKREETSLTLAVTAPNSRLIDAAQPTKDPISPRRPLVYGLSLLFGLAIPIGAVSLRKLMDDKVRSEDDIKEATQVPIAGVLAYQGKYAENVVQPESRSASAEMFRLLRTNLQFAASKQNNKVLMITSGGPGEGKTFVSLNLGMTFAMTGKKVVMIELDLRKPRLIRYLDMEASRMGVTNYLIDDKVTVEDVLKDTPYHEGLKVVPTGPLPVNPAELIQSERMGQLIRELREKFDHVLIDTPPVGPVADSLLLHEHVDTSLFVVRQGVTRLRQLRLIEDISRQDKLPRPYIVLNGVKLGQARAYGYGYGYGYEEEGGKGWRSLFSRN